MRRIRSLAAGLVVASSLVGAGAWAHGATTGQKTGATNVQGTEQKLSTMDHRFLDTAYSDATAEMSIGELAKRQGTSDEVKKLGAQIVNDETAQLSDLRNIAQKDGLTLPQQPNKTVMSEVSRLSKLSGKTFDGAFLRHERTRSHAEVAEFRKEAKDGKNADLKSFATGQIAVLQSHIPPTTGVTAPQPKSGVTNPQAQPKSNQNAPQQNKPERQPQY